MTVMDRCFAGPGNFQNCQIITALIMLTAGMTYAGFKVKITRLYRLLSKAIGGDHVPRSRPL